VEDIFNPVTILLHIVNAVILLAALNFLLYKPVRKFTTARADEIRAQLDHAHDNEEQAQKMVAAGEQKLKEADQEALNTIARGAQRAQEQAKQILAAAQRETEQTVAQAKQEVDTLIANAHETMADEAAALAVEIAAKMLAREVKLDDHRQLVDEFVKKVG
jgi:F-type H+-transporting ATPase subunit b